jgi:alkaline phosphatase
LIIRILICFILCFNLLLTAAFGQGRKYTVSNVHAHNDYNHPVPFYTAYDAGFGSIEADIILKNDVLYVAHDSLGISPKKTLESLYLDPLQEVIKKNKGYVYADSGKNLLLLIDLKTAAEPTLDALLKLLQQYKLVTSCPGLKIVITGNQPDFSKLLSYPPWLFFDGKLDQPYTAEALNKIALFSQDFRNYSSWRGEGALQVSERKKIENAVTKAHSFNKPIRFWAAPDLPNAWHQLMRLNVDYINTDKIQELSSFLVTFHNSQKD